MKSWLEAINLLLPAVANRVDGVSLDVHVLGTQVDRLSQDVQPFPFGAVPATALAQRPGWSR